MPVSSPLLTFIITAYNLPDSLLKACLDSIAQLSFEKGEAEVVVVDDGSDNPVDIETNGWNYNLRIIHRANGGPSAARNTGLAAARGEYIQFVDGDDLILWQNYTGCLPLLRSHKADMVVFSFSRRKSMSCRKPRFSGPVKGCFYMARHNSRAAVWGYVFSRKMARELRFIEGVDHGEDEDFTPRLMIRAKQLYVTSCPCYFYRMREESITKQTNQQHRNLLIHDTEATVLRFRCICNSLIGMEREAMERRTAQLAMDCLYLIIRLTHSRKTFKEVAARFCSVGLFPLPDRHYTWKYRLFRLLSASAIGRRLLFSFIR